MEDFSRQSNIFKPHTFTTPIHVIGAGATGSWLVLLLAKLGIKDITVWDFDVIEEHNLPNQAFMIEDVGYNKADMVRTIVHDFTGANISAKVEKVNGIQKLSGVVFMLTDTMHSRKQIFERAVKYKANVDLLIETRMDLEGGYVYTLNPNDFDEVKEYEKTFYTDEEAAVSACGVSQSICPTAINIASQAVWSLLRWHMKDDMINEVLISLRYPTLLTRKWNNDGVK